MKTSESVTDVGGKLRLGIGNLGPLADFAGISGSGDLDWDWLNTTEKQELKFTFHGDTQINPPPQTFEDALKVYRMLPAKVIFSQNSMKKSINLKLKS